MIRAPHFLLTILLTALMLFVGVSRHALADAAHCGEAGVDPVVAVQPAMHQHAPAHAQDFDRIDRAEAQDDLCCTAGGCPCATLTDLSSARLAPASAIVYLPFLDRRA